MTLRFRIFSLALFISLASFSQDAKQKLSFSSINNIGLLSGEKGNSFSAQTINGIMKDRWFAGAGIGLDEYESKSIPLFLDVRRDFTRKMNTPFVYTDAGINFLVLGNSDKVQMNDRSTSPGLFYDFGLGWKIVLKNNRGILLSAGYSLKQVKEHYKTFLWGAPTEQQTYESNDRYNYQYRRLILKLGIQL